MAMKRKWWAVLLVFWILASGCTVLKKQFGAPKETPELEAARNECKTQTAAAMKKKEKKTNPISKQDDRRQMFRICMREKGYDHLGRKIEQ